VTTTLKRKVQLPRGEWFIGEPDWIDRLEAEINKEPSRVEGWKKFRKSAHDWDERDLITYLYVDSRPKTRQTENYLKRKRKTQIVSECTARMVSEMLHTLPPEQQERLSHLPADLQTFASWFPSRQTHKDNECLAYFASLWALLIKPKSEARGSSFAGLPEYQECIDIIQAAIDATRHNKPFQATRLSVPSLKKFVSKNKLHKLFEDNASLLTP
jgi:hypothetical protein